MRRPSSIDGKAAPGLIERTISKRVRWEMEYIMDIDTRHKCAHEQCQCQIPITQEYCSDYCSDADDIEEVELQCDCKHEPCALN